MILNLNANNSFLARVFDITYFFFRMNSLELLA